MSATPGRTRGESDAALTRSPTLAGPVFVLSMSVSIMALIAGLFGWYRGDVLIAATGMASAALPCALLLLHRLFAERHVAHQALEDFQARVGDIVESAMDAIVSADENQRIVLFNQAAERVFGYPRNAALGQPLSMLIPERLRAGHAAQVTHFGETGVTTRRMGDRTVLPGLRAGGEEFPLEASISQHLEHGRKRYTVILRDVSERLRAEADLARSEARLRGILDSAMDAIITVDENQHVVLFNAAAETVFGCPRNEALGSPLERFIPARFHQGHADHVRRFGEAGASSRRMGAERIVTGLRRNGEEFPIDASISHLVENGNRLYTVILRDVTARVRAETALRESRKELSEIALASSSVREQEKSRIARELHDELAQALTALKMDITWVREHLPDAHPALAGKLATMQGLLDDTVAATRRISADLRPLMLDDLGLIPAVEWLVQKFTQRTGIACELAVGTPELELADPYATAVFRILQESLTNASRHAQATQVEVTLERSEDAVLLSVRDNGVGFSPNDRRKPNSYGLLGLRERADLLGGQTRIDSAPGQGTTIEVSIPLRGPVQS